MRIPDDDQETVAKQEPTGLPDHVKRVVADWPELTPQQLDNIAALLRAGR